MNSRRRLVLMALGAIGIGAGLIYFSGWDLTGRIEKGLNAARDGNYSEAYSWWRPLAERGNADAEYQIGWLYANGNGLSVDMPHAIEWWTRAAEAGNTDASFAIGMAYLNGDSKTQEPDFEAAIRWLVRAGDQGSEDARGVIDRLIKTKLARIRKVHSGILSADWIGTPVRVTSEKAAVRAGMSSNSKRLAETTRGDDLRQLASKSGWALVVLPDASGLGWVRASEVESVAESAP